MTRTFPGLLSTSSDPLVVTERVRAVNRCGTERIIQREYHMLHAGKYERKWLVVSANSVR